MRSCQAPLFLRIWFNPQKKGGGTHYPCFFYIFFKLGFTPCKTEMVLQRTVLQKEAHKGYEYRKSVSKEPSVKRSMLILDLKPLRSQRKAFYRQRIPESSCVRKETVDIYTIVISSNGDRKIMQSTE